MSLFEILGNISEDNISLRKFVLTQMKAIKKNLLERRFDVILHHFQVQLKFVII